MNPLPAPFALGMFRDRPGAPAFVGIVHDESQVVPLSSYFAEFADWPAALPEPTTLFSLLKDWDTSFAAICRAVATRTPTSVVRHCTELETLAPLPEARQLICTGANYRKHVIDLVVAQGAGADTEGMTQEERRVHVTRRVLERAATGIPYAFPKLVSAIAGPYDDIVIPRDAEQFDWELELGVVIGRPAWRVAEAQAASVIAGYLVINDLTRRELVYRPDLKSLGSDWLRSKSGPGFMPMGPYFLPAAFVADPQQLTLTLKLNGQIMQSESTADMMFSIARQIEYVTSYARLLPGDVLATGSPPGNGMHHGRFLRPGDVLEGHIAGMGTQINRMIAEQE